MFLISHKESFFALKLNDKPVLGRYLPKFRIRASGKLKAEVNVELVKEEIEE
jgi:hypothetical protein